VGKRSAITEGGLGRWGSKTKLEQISFPANETVGCRLRCREHFEKVCIEIDGGREEFCSKMWGGSWRE